MIIHDTLDLKDDITLNYYCSGYPSPANNWLIIFGIELNRYTNYNKYLIEGIQVVSKKDVKLYPDRNSTKVNL